MLKKYLPQDLENVSDKVQSMNSLLDNTIQALRKIYSGMRPALLEFIGLKTAVEDHLEKFQEQTGIELDLEIKLEKVELEKSHSLAIFRILQEALNNVKWHSQATYVKVVLVNNSKHVYLAVKDNGVGFDKKKLAASTSFGLIGMKERAEFLRGKLEIEGFPKKGTTVKLRIPIQQ